MSATSTRAGAAMFLFSSNYRAKYFDDCLRALMYPRGMVLHFRYRKDWLDESSLRSIADQTIKHQRVLICYLYQQGQATAGSGSMTTSTESVRPLREGRIVDAYFVGPSVHIYFSVEGYPLENQLEKLRDCALAARRATEPKQLFAIATRDLDRGQFSIANEDDDHAFASIIDSFDKDELQGFAEDGPSMQPLDPLFLRIEGVYRNGTSVPPKALTKLSERERAYPATNDKPLQLRVNFYQPKWSKIDRSGMRLVFSTDNHFDNPSKDQLEVASLYDRAEFYMLPIRTDNDWISRIAVAPSPMPAAKQPKTPDRKVVAIDFTALVKATPIFPKWVVAFSAMASNTTAVILATVSILIAMATASGTGSSAGSSGTLAGLLARYGAVLGGVALAVLSLLIVVTALGSLISYRIKR